MTTTTTDNRCGWNGCTLPRHHSCHCDSPATTAEDYSNTPNGCGEPGPVGPMCEAFAACDNFPTGFYVHPLIGNVPACQRCATRLGETLLPLMDLHALITISSLYLDRSGERIGLASLYAGTRLRQVTAAGWNADGDMVLGLSIEFPHDSDHSLHARTITRFTMATLLHWLHESYGVERLTIPGEPTLNVSVS